MDEINEVPTNIDITPGTEEKAPQHVLQQSQSSWPDWRVDLLKTLWASGMTSEQIGLKLGLNRNQVIGKKWRLGLTRTVKTVEDAAKRAARLTRRRKAEAERRAKRRGIVKTQPPTPADEIIALGNKVHPDVIPSLGVTIEDLTWEGSHPTNCRAIISEDKAYPPLYCGLPVSPNESWCVGHCRRFIARYNPAQPRINTQIVLLRSTLIT